MSYRPSKSLVLTVLLLVALLLGLGGFLLVRSTISQGRPGEIIFKNETPTPLKAVPAKPPRGWFGKQHKQLKQWEHYPWKPKPDNFGKHYFGLLNSADPLDQARAKEVQRLAEDFYPRLLLRYPELAVTLKTVPDERNGFLKWLEFSERRKDASHPVQHFELPQLLNDYFDDPTQWDAVEAAAFLAREKPTIDEIRAIGLMPESSLRGIAADRWWQIPATLTKNSAQALMLEARLAAGQGDAATALESIRSAKGLADHLIQLETPTLLGAVVQLGIQRQLENFVFTEILPALPAGQIDPVAWENALRPTVHPPAEFARILKGEWTANTLNFLLPILLDADDLDPLPDPGDLLDAHAAPFVEIVRSHQTAKITDWPTLPLPPDPDISHLSKKSQSLAKAFQIQTGSLRAVWEYDQSASGLTQAAFAILKGLPLPRDPIHGHDYGWEPATRELSLDKMGFDPLVLPTP